MERGGPVRGLLTLQQKGLGFRPQVDGSGHVKEGAWLVWGEEGGGGKGGGHV